MDSTADAVIIGAGAIGCSTAYHLARLGITDVVVVEMDQVGSGSSGRSASMLSLQFVHDELVARLALASYGRYMAFEDEIGNPIGFRRTGWLSVATAEVADDLLQSAERLLSLGIRTEILNPAEIHRRCPEINISDLAIGTYGSEDGSLDPHMILWGYVRRARELGVQLRQGVRAVGLAMHGEQVSGVVTTEGFIATRLVINAAGPWASDVGRWAGVHIPLLNRGRTILVTGPLAAIPHHHPFVEDVGTEWYFRPEGDGVLMGMGQEPVDNLDHPGASPAMVDAMIDAAVHRVPILARASVLTTWAGVRPLTPDGRPILGQVPGLDGLLLNCGWGGMGIIKAPMAGQLLAEIAQGGRASTCDVTPFGLARFG